MLISTTHAHCRTAPFSSACRTWPFTSAARWSSSSRTSTEVDTRGLHLKSGYGSLYAYCRGALRLSEFEAYSRIEAARAALRFPVIFERLADGALNLTTMTLLARHLTAENHLELLESARGRSKSEVKKIVARLAPKPDVATSVRKVPAPRSAPSPIGGPSPVASPPARPTMAPTDAPLGSNTPDASVLGRPARAAVANATATPADPSTSVAIPTTATIARAESRRAAVDALSPDRYKLQLTIDGDTLEMLRLAQDMSRHTNPSGDESQILSRHLRCSSSSLPRPSSRPRTILGRRGVSRPIRATCRRRSSARYGCGTGADVPSSATTSTDARNAASSNSTTCARMPRAARRRSRTSHSGVGFTTGTNGSCGRQTSGGERRNGSIDNCQPASHRGRTRGLGLDRVPIRSVYGGAREGRSIRTRALG